ncbi:MAG: hypothetical protein KGZ72_11860 [Roseovarius sp.]|nr:hypothetical protein [Roseovarius sp.]
MLVMVPQGCDEGGAARHVRQWVQGNFVPPSAFSNHRPICIDLVADGLESSGHFANVISKRIALELQIEIEGECGDFPTDILQNAIEAAIDAGAFPILVIQRFHAFANIRDGGMTSILSRLRTLEGEGQMTTLAFSPIGYDAIRRKMDSEQPFLNSVYGDMHDEAVMTPLKRDDFLAEAKARGIDSAIAHRLFGLGGGPDAVFMKLLDLHSTDGMRLVSECADRAGPMIDSFLERAIPEHVANDKILANLAFGALNSAQEAFLLNHPLGPFLCKFNGSGKLICSTPIIAHRILSKDIPLWSQYLRCLLAVEAADYVGAARLATHLTDSHPRLAAFREIVLLRGALAAVPERGLLGIDWREAEAVISRLRRLDMAATISFQPWIQVVDASLRIVFPDRGNQRLQADNYTRKASDPQVRLLVLFMVEGVVCAAPMLDEPSARVDLLRNVPEVILQSLAAGFCEIDFSSPPSPPPTANYSTYFGSKEQFSFPTKDQKLALGSLLVIVPALLAQRQVKGASTLIDPSVMRRLQQKLVDEMRNPASHTIAEFSQKDANFLEDLCARWISEWCCIESLASTNELPIRKLAPDTEQLRALLFGSELLSPDPATDNLR